MVRFLLVAALTGSFASQQPKQAKAANAQQDSARDVRGTAQSPAIVKVLPAEKTQAEADAETREKEEHTRNERRIANGTIWLARITGALALGTVILAAFTFKLWKSTHKLAVESKATGDAQVEKLQGYVDQLPMRSAESEPVNMDGLTWRPLGVLGPGQKHRVNVWIEELTDEDVAEVYKRKPEDRRLVYVFGSVRYTDAFGGQRMVDFCFWINAGGGDAAPHLWNPSFQGNNSD